MKDENEEGMENGKKKDAMKSKVRYVERLRVGAAGGGVYGPR
jgi:hypothetical protein